MKHSFLVIINLFYSVLLFGQTGAERAVGDILANKNEKLIGSNEAILIRNYIDGDSATRVWLLGFLGEKTNSNDAHTAVRSLVWKAIMICRVSFDPAHKNINTGDSLMQQAISRAVESGDEYLMVECFDAYADFCYNFIHKPEAALFYYLKSIELRKRNNSQYFRDQDVKLLGTIGELLFQMEEYKQAIQYVKQAVSLPPWIKNGHTGALNTIGLAYQRMARYDSAMYWYEQSMQTASTHKDSLWMGIISGNIGALYFEQQQDEKALPLLWKDYYACLQQEANNAGNTLHRIALIYLRHNRTDSALLLARTAFNLVSTAKPSPNPSFLSNTSFALSEVYRKKGFTDSAFYYSGIHQRFKDSLNRAVARNRADVVQIKLDFEKTSNQINVLLDERQSERTRRNLLLAGIGLLLIAGWLYFRWQKQRHLAKQQELIHQKQMADADIANARSQLEEFTLHNIQKNELIETLQQQLQQQNMQVNEELLKQTILTENDWLRFKDMFDKANPGFISQLKTIAPDITTAEIRFAALTRLNLGNKHIASMLGIGADAVRKTKSRLRQRLQLAPETELEDFIKGIRI